MKVAKIEFPTALSKIKDIGNGNIDVIVELEDGFTYMVVVSTPKNYYWYMEKKNIDYYYGDPDIIVKKLTEETITEAINKYAEGDAYLRDLHHVSLRFSKPALRHGGLWSASALSHVTQSFRIPWN